MKIEPENRMSNLQHAQDYKNSNKIGFICKRRSAPDGFSHKEAKKLGAQTPNRKHKIMKYKTSQSTDKCQ